MCVFAVPLGPEVVEGAVVEWCLKHRFKVFHTWRLIGWYVWIVG
jgi:hypothetical protein